jgi:hypothetical protein
MVVSGLNLRLPENLDAGRKARKGNSLRDAPERHGYGNEPGIRGEMWRVRVAASCWMAM